MLSDKAALTTVDGREFEGNQQLVLSEAEVRLWKDCLRESFFFGSLPFGLVFPSIFIYKETRNLKNMPNAPSLSQIPISNFAKKGIFSVAFGIVTGHLLYLPTCYARLKDAILANRKNLKEEEVPVIPPEDNILRPDAYYSGNFDPGSDGPGSTFSPDFESHIDDNIIFEDEKIKQSPILETTYDDLRRQNREFYAKSSLSEAVPQSRATTLQFRAPPKPQFPEASMRKPKNQYGDDME